VALIYKKMLTIDSLRSSSWRSLTSSPSCRAVDPGEKGGLEHLRSGLRSPLSDAKEMAILLRKAKMTRYF